MEGNKLGIFIKAVDNDNSNNSSSNSEGMSVSGWMSGVVERYGGKGGGRGSVAQGFITLPQPHSSTEGERGSEEEEEVRKAAASILKQAKLFLEQR